jgi:putative ABC transport system permease protein
MLWYTLLCAWRSVRSTPWLSLVAIVGLALGVAVPTTLISLRHVFAKDPIPSRSHLLYTVRVDNWDANSEFFGVDPGDPPKHIAYRDMVGLMESDIPVGETGIASATVFVFPDDPNLRPFQAMARLCHADFFSMFQAPFLYGSGWSSDDDRRATRVVVLKKETNDRLFGGENSIGRTLRLGTRDFTVVGVLDTFRPLPQSYDIINNGMGEPRDLFVPFDLVLESELGFTQFGDTDGWGNQQFDTRADYVKQGEFNWIQYWVQLRPGEDGAYRDWVDGYAMNQKTLGRFPRELNNRVHPLMEWMQVRGVVPDEIDGVIAIGLLFMIVCCLNLMGLLLAKFLSKSGVLGVHRALGASRSAVFLQRLAECALIGIVGGALGALLSGLSLRLMNAAFPPRVVAAEALVVDGYALFVAVLLALAAGVASGLYPAWRACRVAPAIQLKVN